VLARVMTFYATRGDLATLAESLRSELPPIYGPFPGFKGLLVLEKPDPRSHVIALTLWEDEESLQASEKIADTFAEQITHAAGNAVARNVYNVMGSIGIE
jgi:heme-degrading monooxygenase HmoA